MCRGFVEPRRALARDSIMQRYPHLRLASLADLPQIAALLEQCRLTTDGVAEIIDSFHGAHCDGRVIGYAAAEPHGESIVIRSVAVEPTSRDRGVATRPCRRPPDACTRHRSTACSIAVGVGSRLFRSVGLFAHSCRQGAHGR